MHHNVHYSQGALQYSEFVVTQDSNFSFNSSVTGWRATRWFTLLQHSYHKHPFDVLKHRKQVVLKLLVQVASGPRSAPTSCSPAVAWTTSCRRSSPPGVSSASRGSPSSSLRTSSRGGWSSSSPSSSSSSAPTRANSNCHSVQIHTRPRTVFFKLRTKYYST